jgi:hypothetical protein
VVSATDPYGAILCFLDRRRYILSSSTSIVLTSLCLITKAIYHEDLCVIGGTAASVLTLSLDGGEWSASGPCHFTPGE